MVCFRNLTLAAGAAEKRSFWVDPLTAFVERSRFAANYKNLMDQQ